MTRSVTKATLCSTLAIATAMVMMPQRARAQSFVGSINYTSPNVVSVDQSIVNQTTVTLSAGQSVINWGATNAAVGGVRTFQAAGTTATFTSAGDFAVLNRVGAGFDAIKLDGTINSLVNGQTGGTVFFQSNNGIVIGRNAVINVGSLGLITLDRNDDGQGNWMDGFGTSSPSVTFGAALDPNSYITVEAGAQLKANGAGNYVALIAPKITHMGIIRTDGGAALVGAAAATITFSNSNLYNIQVDAPSTFLNAVTVDGGKIIANNVDVAADRRAYVVAMAPNDANTVLITGGAEIGFGAATTASVVGNAVVLSAGGGISYGDPYWSDGTTGQVTVDGASITSNFTALGRNGVSVGNATGATSFSNDVHLFAPSGNITIGATTGDLSIGGILDANASFTASNGAAGVANNIDIYADGANASVTVQGDVFLTANGRGGSGNSDFPNGGNGMGGIIAVVAKNNALIDFHGNLTAGATGRGGSPAYGSGGVAGSGTGGMITLAADVGTTSGVRARGQTSLDASGRGGSDSDGDSVYGGAGIGGTVAVRASDASGNFVDISGLNAEASGFGGSGDFAGGDGIGGTVTVSTINGASLFLYNPTLVARGEGGSSVAGIGGGGQGGTPTLSIDGGATQVYGDISIDAAGVGGNGLDGGNGVGGDAAIYVFNGGALTLNRALDFPGTVTVSANGSGGSATGGTGGSGSGGTARVQTFGSAIAFDAALDIKANGLGGQAGSNGLSGGLGQGGSSTIAANGGSISVGEDSFVEAIGTGGATAAFGQIGADGIGGSALALAINGGSLSFGRGAILSAGALGGDGSGGSVAGNGIGGGVDYSIDGTGSIISSAPGSGLDADVGGSGGNGTIDGGGGNGQGGSITVAASNGGILNTASLRLSASGVGRSGNVSGSAQGGNILIRATGGGRVAAQNSYIDANASGGWGFGDGASGTGGYVIVEAGDTSEIALTGYSSIAANGSGGPAAATSAVGAGYGGTVLIRTLSGGGTITFGDYLYAEAIGYGGRSNGGGAIAGSAQGGSVTIDLNGGQVNGATFMSLTADGVGGSADYDCSICDGVGGVGVGGLAAIYAGPTGGTVNLGSNTRLSAAGIGGDGGTGTGGAGQGGSAIFNTGAASVTGVNVSLDAHGEGGNADSANGGVGLGGITTFQDDAGTVAFSGALSLNGTATGGNSNSGNGGAATGGQVNVYLFGAAGRLAVGGLTALDSSALGGTSGSGAGGNATGGFSQIYSDSGVGQFVGDVSLLSNAAGGGGGSGNGGNALGGSALLQVINSTAALTFNGAATLDASATGGASSSGNGGNATGGDADIFIHAAGSTLTVGGTTTLTSDASSGFSNSGNGGTASAGISQLVTSGGTGSFSGDTLLRANAVGGGSSNGDGGVATGGIAQVGSLSGTLAFGAALSARANAIGGYGINGGDAFGNDPGVDIVSGIYATRGGTVSVAGATVLTATTVGGDAHDTGHGGNATSANIIYDINNQAVGGGYVGIFVKGSATVASSVTLAGLSVDSSATGGAGANGLIGLSGGNGGSAIGGAIFLETRNSNVGINLLHFADATLDSHATGGNGGLAGDDSTGGGNGGDATSGFIAVSASAGNGRLETGALTINGAATGGNGGYGGTNSFPFGVTGNGGSGGNAIAGGTGFGVVSNNPSTSGTGSASIGNIFADVRATGGNGGNTGTGGSTLGLAGNGGSAEANYNTLYSRGGNVVFANVDFNGVAQGGNGGLSNIGGIGGTASTGGLRLLSTVRYLVPTQPGSLAIGGLTGNFDAIAGAGVSPGQAYNVGEILVQALGGSSIQIGSFNVHSNAANGVGVGAFPSRIELVNSSLNVTNDFTLDTTGELSVMLDNSTMSANSVSLSAGNFVHDNLIPAALGTISAGHFSISSANNIILDANLNSTGIDYSLLLNAPGLIQTGGLNSINNVGLIAGNFIQTQGISADGSINLDAQGSIQTGNLNAGYDINLVTTSGSILFGDAHASRDFDFQGGAIVGGGNITAGRQIGGDAVGAVTLGNLTAGFANSYGPTDKGFSIGFSSLNSITVGNATGAEGVGFATLGPLTTGNLNAGTDMLAMVSGNMNLGAITVGSSGRIYLADGSMFAAAGGTNNFDPALVFAATPVATHGSITINGPVTGRSFQAAAGTGLASGAIDVGGGISVTTVAGGITANGGWMAGGAIGATAAGLINVGSVSSGAGVNLTAGSTLTSGSIDAVGDIHLDGGTGIAVGNLTAGDSIYARSVGGPISAGNIAAVGGASPYNVQLDSGTSLTTGTIDASGHVVLSAGTDISTGAINAALNLLGMAGGAMNLGAINASYVWLGDVSLAAAGGDLFGLYDVNAVIAQTQVRSGGAITALDISAGGINVAAGTDFSAGALAGFNELTLDGGGNIVATSMQTLGDVNVSADGSIAVSGAIGAGGAANLTAGTTLASGNISAVGAVLAQSGGNMAVGNVSGGPVRLLSGGALSAGTVDGAIRLQALGGNMAVGDVASTTGLIVDGSGGNVLLGNLSTAGTTLTALGTATIGDIIGGNGINATAGGDITTGNIDVIQGATLTSNAGSIAIGNFVADGGTNFHAAQNISAGTILSRFSTSQMIAGGNISVGATRVAKIADFEAGGTLTGSTISAGDSIFAIGLGGVSLGALDAGIVNPDTTLGARHVLGVISDGNIVSGALNAASNLSLGAGGNLTTGSIQSGGSPLLMVGGNASVGAVTAPGALGITGYDMFAFGGGLTAFNRSIVFTALQNGTASLSGGSVAIGGAINVNDVFASVGGNFSAAALNIGHDLRLFAGGNANIGAVRSNGITDIETGGSLTGTTISAGGEVSLWGQTGVSVGNIDSGIVNPDTSPGATHDIGIGSGPTGSITTGTLTAADSVGFGAGGNLTVGTISAGGDSLAMVGGNASFGAVTANGLFGVTGYDMVALGGGKGNFDKTIVFAALRGGTASNSGGAVSFSGPVGATDVFANAGTDFTAGAIDVGHDLHILAGGNATVGAIRSGGITDIDVGGSMTGTTISAGGDVSLWGQTGVSVGNIDAGILNPDTSLGVTYDIGIGSGATGSITTGTLTAAGDIGFAAGGDLNVGTILAGGDTLAMVGGNAVFGAVDTVDTLGVTGYDMLGVGGGKGNFDKTVVLAALFGGTASRTGGDVTFTGPVSATDIYVLAGGNLSGLGFGAGNELMLDAGGDVAVVDLLTSGNIDAHADGTLSISGLLDGFAINLSSGTDMMIGDITSHSAITFSSAGNLTVGNLTTLPSAFFAAAAIAPSALDISLRSGGALTTGTLNSAGSIFLGADGGIVAGDLTAVNAVLALAGGDISIGAIAAGSDVYIAGIGNEARGGTIGQTFDPNPVVAIAPTSSAASVLTGIITTPGALTISAVGDVALPSASGGTVAIDAANLTVGAISSSGSLRIAATGLASINGSWTGSTIDLSANDLAISANGAVQGGAVSIVSSNANGMFLGDGLTGSGFNLSQAEASQIGGSQVAYASAGGTGPAMTIGNLTLSAAQMTGAEPYRFSAGGSIKIVGDLAINGVSDPASSVGFYTPLFMLDESTGSLALMNGSQLGGTLNIHAHDVWIADSTILARLLADPNYVGRDADLAVAPSGVSGPVVSASTINVVFENGGPRNVTPYTLLVQNTGDATTQQGFLATDANAILGTGASGLIDMVINGQGQTESGLISGVAVRDALMAGEDPARFTATSTINGCSVSGAQCGAAPPPPPPPPPPNEPPPVADPGVVVADEIVLFSIGADDKPLFGNEEQIVQNLDDLLDPAAADASDPATAEEEQKKKEEEEDAASSPIAPPNPLFDSRPLNVKDSTDEPISGGGNPALIGSDVDPIGGQ